MVCIAAFIILALVGIFVAIISIFKRDVGRKYLQVMKKSWGCVGKKIRLQKCETNFKEDVKHTLLKKVVLKHPGAVKPLSVIIEILAVVIVLVVIWAILTAIKSLLALWTIGSCNVSQPSACSLSSEVCSLDDSGPSNIIEATGRWFTEWGDIVAAIPDRLRDWPAESYLPDTYIVVGEESADKPYALDIFDPGCSVCMRSYKNQQASGFFDRYNTVLIPYAIQADNGEYKFPNSDLIVRYIHAATIASTDAGIFIIDQIFTKSNEEGINYQSVINNQLDNSATEKLLQKWLKDSGLSDAKIKGIISLANSEQVNKRIEQVADIVNRKIHVKGIPTMLYDNKIHMGLYED